MTLLLKENNLRIKFDDTSNTAGFPANDWQLIANDAGSGGANKFSIEDTTGGKVPFTVTAGAPTDSIFVASSGRVGFRTAVPVLDLHVKQGNTPGLRLEQDASSGFTAQTWDVASNETNFFIRDVTNGSTLPLRISPGSPSSSLAITPTGVGVGTNSPAGKFHVSGASTQLSIFQSTDDGAVQFRLKTNSTNRRFVALNSLDQQQSQIIFNDNGAFEFLGLTAADQRLSILSSGRVGIGTSAPDQRLSVNGNASKTGGGSWLAFSDERLKNIKGPYLSGLDAALQLQPIRYDYKEDNALGLKAEGEQIGFGAQALQKIIPEAVTRNADGYLMVNNDPILWTMLNAIKEQNKEIAELKEQLKRLQAEVVLNAQTKKPTANKAVAETAR